LRRYEMSDPRHITAREVAAMLGLAHTSLCTYAKRYGVGEKRGRDWLYNQDDIAVIAARMRIEREGEIG